MYVRLPQLSTGVKGGVSALAQKLGGGSGALVNIQASVSRYLLTVVGGRRAGSRVETGKKVEGEGKEMRREGIIHLALLDSQPSVVDTWWRGNIAKDAALTLSRKTYRYLALSRPS